MFKKPNSQKGNSVVGLIIVVAIVWGGYSLFFNKEPASNVYEPSTYNSASVYSSYNDDTEDSEYYEEPENPYNEGSGHSAGYEWAEENDVGSCGGNSDSFIEGCEEYLLQQENYENSY